MQVRGRQNVRIRGHESRNKPPGGEGVRLNHETCRFTNVASSSGTCRHRGHQVNVRVGGWIRHNINEGGRKVYRLHPREDDSGPSYTTNCW